jgi:hypothetical protein
MGIILHIIGGKLEISKCKFSVIRWEQNKNGTMVLDKSKRIEKINIKDSESGEWVAIDEIAAGESYKLHGVPLATINS